MKPCSLELGGKSAAIILDDAGLELFLSQAPMVSMGGNGQGCVLSTRVLVARALYGDLQEGLTAMIRQLPVGDPHNPETVFGPLAMERQRDRVESYIRSGVEEGAKLLVGEGTSQPPSPGILHRTDRVRGCQQHKQDCPRGNLWSAHGDPVRRSRRRRGACQRLRIWAWPASYSRRASTVG